MSPYIIMFNTLTTQIGKLRLEGVLFPSTEKNTRLNQDLKMEFLTPSPDLFLKSLSCLGQKKIHFSFYSFKK